VNATKVTGTQTAVLPEELAGALLRAAVAAPSLHNTQPWRFAVRAASATIEVYADPARGLPVADPHGRAVHIACGAALFNLRMAAAAAGLQPRVRLHANAAQPLLLATVTLAGPHRATASEHELHAAIARRQSNREPFSGRPVPPGIQAELAEAASLEGAVLRFPDHAETRRLLRLAADAERDQLADPGYRAELARWAGGERDHDGISESLAGPRSPRGPAPVRDFVPGRWPVPYAWFEDHPQLAVLSVPHSHRTDWLRAGQALQRVLLTVTVRGIAACPLTPPLETADAWLVRDPRVGMEYPQVILRLGYGLPLTSRSPRRPLSEVR
jgi:nitroreductase